MLILSQDYGNGFVGVLDTITGGIERVSMERLFMLKSQGVDIKGAAGYSKGLTFYPTLADYRKTEAARAKLLGQYKYLEFSDDYATVVRCDSGIENVEVPDFVECIGEKAFDSCKIKNIVIPSSVKTIKDKAFNCCRSLETVKLPGSLISLGEGVFSFCESLSYIEMDLAKITILPENTFASCYQLRQIVLPASVKVIESNAVRGCVNLVSVLIPEGVEVIKNNAFFQCDDLSYVVLPKSIKKVDDKAFPSGCRLLSLSEDRGIFER